MKRYIDETTSKNGTRGDPEKWTKDLCPHDPRERDGMTFHQEMALFARPSLVNSQPERKGLRQQ
jgi:hypothetical protein